MLLSTTMVFAETKQTTEADIAVTVAADENGFVIEDGVLLWYKGNAEKVVVPEGVTSIRSQAFYNCSNLKNLELPESLTSIGWGYFTGCSSLKAINVEEKNTAYMSREGCLYTKDAVELIKCPEGKEGNAKIQDGVTSIDAEALINCTNLKEIELPKSLMSIKGEWFVGCTSLRAFNIEEGNTAYMSYDGCIYTKDKTVFIACPGGREEKVEVLESVTVIRDSAFEGCSSLKEILLPEGLRSISYEAFKGCSNLKKITLPEGLMGAIRNSTFMGCSSLTNIRIPSGISSIENWAFSGASNLKEIGLPESLTDIGAYAFEGCSSLEEISLPSGVTEIGTSVFSNCSSLRKITLREGLLSIGTAFTNCGSLTEITIPKSVEDISDSAFNGCSSLKAFHVEDGNAFYMDYDGCLYTKDRKTLIKCLEGKAGKIEIPEGVTSIESFVGCNSLEEIILPESITTIASFSGCSSLTAIKIPEKVKGIRGWTFKGCTNLKEIILPEGLESINQNAFSGCSSLEEITIPKGVTYIGYNVFEDCSSLVNIKVSEGNTAYMSHGRCLYTKDKAFVVCPRGLEGKVEVLEGTEIIGAAAFSSCKKVTEIIIPSGVTRIEENAFEECSSLTDIMLPEGVWYIDSGSFYNCSSLTEVKLPESLKYIGEWVFSGCSNLTKITFSENITYIGGDVFEGCDKLTIYGKAGSYAEIYAKDNQIPFSTIGLEMKKESTDDIYVLGSEKGVRITCSGVLADIVNVYVDGILIDKANYTLNGEDSTVVTFTKEFMETLSEGKHIFTLEYTEDRKSEVAVTVVKFLLGDVDSDGKVTADDALAILKYLAGLKQETFVGEAADCDKDEKITADDALAILKYLVGIIKLF